MRSYFYDYVVICEHMRKTYILPSYRCSEIPMHVKLCKHVKACEKRCARFTNRSGEICTTCGKINAKHDRQSVLKIHVKIPCDQDYSHVRFVKIFLYGELHFYTRPIVETPPSV